MFSNSQLDYIQGVLRGIFLDIYINKSKIERIGKCLSSIAVDKPHQNPSAQAKDEPNIWSNRQGHGLDAEKILLLDRLCADQAATDEPELIDKENNQDDDIIMEEWQEQNQEQEHKQQHLDENQPLLHQEQQQWWQQFELQQLDLEQQRH